MNCYFTFFFLFLLCMAQAPCFYAMNSGNFDSKKLIDSKSALVAIPIVLTSEKISEELEKTKGIIDSERMREWWKRGEPSRRALLEGVIVSEKYYGPVGDKDSMELQKKLLEGRRPLPYRIGSREIQIATPLGLAALHAHTPVELIAEISLDSSFPEGALLGYEGFGYQIVLCNALGYDIPAEKKQAIVNVLKKRDRYDRHKYALMLSALNDYKNAMRFLLVEGEFHPGRELDLFIESSKKFIGRQTHKDMEDYRQGFFELSLLFNDQSNVVQLLAYGGMDIFPSQLSSIEFLKKGARNIECVIS